MNYFSFKKNINKRACPAKLSRSGGMTVVETVVAIAIFSILATIAYGVFIASDNLLKRADQKSTALWLAEEGVEAARSIRDEAFTNLTDGAYGLSNSSNKWVLAGSSDVSGNYTRVLNISTVSPDEKDILVTVNWDDKAVTNSLSLNSRLTNWHKLDYNAGLTVEKVVINHGGNATSSRFAPYTVSITVGTTTTDTVVEPGVANQFAPGVYTVTETPDPDYNQTFSLDCDASGQVTVVASSTKVCRITNEEKYSKLKVTKTVINHGNNKVVSDFSLLVDSNPVTSGVTNDFNSGLHTVSENPDSQYDVSVGGDCDSGGLVTLFPGLTKNCTITNEEKLSYVVVNKNVINYGGTAVEADFEPYKVGATTVTLGATTTKNSGTYNVTETVDPAYTQTFSGDCNGAGSITLIGGTTKVCTITNEENLVVPTVTSPTATSITTVTATLGANVTSTGVPHSITARGTCWGTTPAPTTNCLDEGATTTGVFTQARTGFSAGTTYYYRGYATNSTGIAYSPDATFTTISAICNTSFLNNLFHVCYFSGMTAPTGAVVSLSQFDEITVPSPVGSWSGFNNNWAAAEVDSTGLLDLVSAVWRGNINFQAGSYIFHTVSDDGIELNVTGFGNVINNWTDHATTQDNSSSIILPAGYRNVQLRWYENGGEAVTRLWWDYEPLAVPTVTTPTVANITTQTATLGATVSSLGVPASITARGTCWGTSPNPTTNCVAEGGTTTGVFTQARTGFTAGTLYYYRGYATNSTGTGYSSDGTFTAKALCLSAPVGTPTVYNGNNSTSAVVTKPTGVTTGDIMFAHILHNNATDRLNNIPAGWLPAGGTGRHKNGNFNQALYYKVATASEGANYTFGLSNGSRFAVTISAYRGCFNTTTPIDVFSNVEYVTSNTTYRAASMVLPSADATVLMFPSVYDNSVRTFANPLTQGGGWTEDYDHGNTTSRWFRAGYRKFIVAPGATSDINSIGLTGTTIKHAFGVGLKPL